MVHPDHGDDLRAVLSVSLGLAHNELLRVEAAGFEVDRRCAEVETLVTVAAKASRWGDALLGLMALATYEPEAYLGAWETMAISLLGSTGSPGPAPLPPHVPARRWSSDFGNATQLPSGALRVELPVGGADHIVTLPLVVEGRKR